jgi:hypothetical protein
VFLGVFEELLKRVEKRRDKKIKAGEKKEKMVTGN